MRRPPTHLLGCLLALCTACTRELPAPGLDMPIAVRADASSIAEPAAIALSDALHAEATHLRLTLPAPLPAGQRGRLRVECRHPAGGELRLGAVVAGEASPRHLPLAQALRADQWTRCEFDLDAACLAGLPVESFTLHPPDASLPQLELRALQWLPAHPARPGVHRLDEVLRPAHALRAGEALQWNWQGAAKGALLLAVGAEGARATRDSFELRLSAHCASADHPLWEGHVRSHPARWQSLRVAAPACTDARHQLRMLHVDGGVQRGFALVTAPRLVGMPRPELPNILLIVIDTLRADGLSATGNARPSSPAIDRFLAGCVRYANAYATASWTHPSLGSLLSGLHPHQHGLGLASRGFSHLHAGTTLLAERLHELGYHSAAASNNPIVSSAEGFARGYECFDERALLRPEYEGAMRVSHAAWEWLEQRPAPFHLYLHYFDPHDRYQAPPPWTEHFVENPQADLPSGIREGNLQGLLARMFKDGRPTKALPRPDELQRLRELYDGEVLYADHWIGWLLERMEGAGLLEETVVVLTSDHGEEFLEHGRLKHGHSLYDELVRVPLAIRIPGQIGRVVETPVSLVDLLPTILARLGRADAQLPGRDLLEPGAARPVFALAPAGLGSGELPAHGTQQMIRLDDWKLIRQLEPPRLELYDLASDPGELHDRSDSGDPSALLEQLDALFGDLSALDLSQQRLDPAALEKLRALGYAN